MSLQGTVHIQSMAETMNSFESFLDFIAMRDKDALFGPAFKVIKLLNAFGYAL